MSSAEPAGVPHQQPPAPEGEEDFGADLSDTELDELLIREITIDGMCGVY